MTLNPLTSLKTQRPLRFMVHKASNGVVIITTKKGRAGKTKFDVNMYWGTG
jgi:hypothetical protein